jgi:putative drug exporter of the RND superfamily
MFRWLGNSVSHASPVWLAVWLVALIGTWAAAPRWAKVAIDDDDALLKADAPSRRAEVLFRQAFPDDLAASNVVIVLHRPGSKGTYLDADKRFVNDVLEPNLRKITGLADAPKPAADDSPFSNDAPPPAVNGPVLRMRTPNAAGIGDLLVSPDREAMLIVLDLSHGFLSETNAPIVAAIEKCLDALRSDGAVPNGMQLNLTGSAVVGRDQRRAEVQGARSTEALTIGLVIVLLLLIYRAPLLALIPLFTVVAAVKVSLSILALLASAGKIRLFPGIEVYTTILAYGAGVDFTLFLIARYKEGLDSGQTLGDAVAGAIFGVGATITASAFTVICGLGTLVFAEFGKFQQAGTAIALSLTIVWMASLTLSPALLKLAGRWVFWPRALTSIATPQRDLTAVLADPHGKMQPTNIREGWVWAVSMIVGRPALVLATTVGLLLPFAGLAFMWHDRVSYNLIGNLPSTAQSVIGTQALEAHFPAGMTGQVSVLVNIPTQDFRKPAGRDLIKSLTERLRNNREGLSLGDVRSMTAPLGIGPASKSLAGSATPEAIESAAADTYVSSLGERGAPATRLDLVFQQGPFVDASIVALAHVEALIKESLPSNAAIYLAGTTATIRDLQRVMQRDRGRIEWYVLLSVFVVLVLLLRQVVVPVYLLLSVLLSYYATLGVTFAVFWALDPAGFVGLDWKVTVFLFAILIAVGEDYNIFLVSRVDEEQKRFDPIRSVSEALVRTGPIISSCGVIMAGTFASLLAGTLTEMRQLGFALAFGVLLDTFVVRPILVPTFLILKYGRK